MPAAANEPDDASSRPDATAIAPERAIRLLREGVMTVQGLLPWSSNYSFAVTVTDAELACLAVYKPRRGERPLWDFPQGTLCRRETAAYVVSELLGWQLVPPTVLRDGQYGTGSLQLFVDVNPEEHYLTFRNDCVDVGRQIAAFDAIINNADRKSGHILRDSTGHIWCIDHGVCFHEDDKLRTVIWEFAGESLPESIRRSIARLQIALAPGAPASEALQVLLSPRELRALDLRVARLLRTGTYPLPSGDWPSVPWPVV